MEKNKKKHRPMMITGRCFFVPEKRCTLSLMEEV